MALRDRNSTKTPISIKIDSELDARIKKIRAVARSQGKKFNMSADIEKHLKTLVKQAEKQLGIDYKGGTEETQGDLFED